MSTPFLQLKKGDKITPTHYISPQRQWDYKLECDGIGGGMMPGAELIVTQTGGFAGNAWLKVDMPAFSPTRSLKISAQEFAMNFKKK